MFSSFRITVTTSALQVLFVLVFYYLDPTRISDQRFIYWFPFLSSTCHLLIYMSDNLPSAAFCSLAAVPQLFSWSQRYPYARTPTLSVCNTDIFFIAHHTVCCHHSSGCLRVTWGDTPHTTPCALLPISITMSICNGDLGSVPP